MLLKLKRTQKTAIGRLLMDETYIFDMENPRQKAVAKSLIERKMAEEVSKKDHAGALKKAKKASAADQAAADQAAADQAAADQAAADQAAADQAAKK